MWVRSRVGCYLDERKKRDVPWTWKRLDIITGRPTVNTGTHQQNSDRRFQNVAFLLFTSLFKIDKTVRKRNGKIPHIGTQILFPFLSFPCGMTTEMCLTSLILKRRARDPKMWITRSYLLTWFYYISMDEWFSDHEPTERKEGSEKLASAKTYWP